MTQSTIKFEVIDSINLRDEGSVMLSNNVECKVAGICIVKVNILNQIMKTSDNMRDVIELEKNLISLGYQIFCLWIFCKRWSYERITKGSL